MMKVTDSLKEKKAIGRILQVVGVVIIFVGTLSCLVAPFTDHTVKDGFQGLCLGILSLGVGKVVEWIYSD